VIGTPETDLAKDTRLPSLHIPTELEFSPPKKLLLIVNNPAGIDFKQITSFVKRLNIKTCYAFNTSEINMDISAMLTLLNQTMKNFNGVFKSVQLDKGGTIDELLEIENPDWISYINFDEHLFKRLFKKNTNQLLLESKIPVVHF